MKRFFDKRDGKTYAYHRKSGTRITAPFGTAGFIAELDRIEKAWSAKGETRKGTFGHLVEQYRASPEFLRLKPVTKRDYERVMTNLAAMKDVPLRSFDRAVVTDLRNKAFRKHKRRHANYVVQVLSRMFNIGIGLGLVQSNPAENVEKVRKATGEANRNRPWTSAERDAVLEAAPIQLKAPLALMRYLGVRLGDVRGMPNGAYRDGMISFRTGKGDVDVTVPCPAPLAEILDQRLPHETHLFCSSSGVPWTEGGFHASLRKLLSKLKVAGKIQEGLTPHGLRHSVATDLRELGKTEREIADILGQRTTFAVPTYSRTADMKRSNARSMEDLYGPAKPRSLPSNVSGNAVWESDPPSSNQG
ncbi:tyrosine-type recombinase/integrase [Methylobacterium sp. Leaf89]|uniref:tyrosine-type recombinase/integrase n=1 Tax=Methylobacterium sp. Leaf89 TaxID=1736245 RepID=UPI001AEBCF7D|nr:tyrosine-type recombinase/integrase [Methylobacterium sp. Leaf89]